MAVSNLTDTSEQRRQEFHTTGPPRLQHPHTAPMGSDDTTTSQISHAIRLEEVSTMPENVAIATLSIHDSKESRGNCMRNWGSSAMMWILINTTRPTGVEGAGGAGGPAAVPVGGGGAWPDNEPMRRTTNQHTRPHWCGGRRRDRRARLRCRWAVGGGRWRGLARQHTETPTDWRPPRGLRGLAGLRADAPSEARGADGERAGRPRGGRRSVGATSNKQRIQKRPPGTGWAYLSRLWESNPRPIHYE